MKENSVMPMVFTGSSQQNLTLNKISSEIQSTDLSKKFYELRNKRGLRVMIDRNSARIVKLFVPDAMGNPVNIISDHNILDSQVQRVDNFTDSDKRIVTEGVTGFLDLEQSQFTIYPDRGTYKIVWSAIKNDDNDVSFLCDMKFKFLDDFCVFTINYRFLLTEDNTIVMKHEITTDRKLILRALDATYFNLNGCCDKAVLRHQLYINADEFGCLRSCPAVDNEIKNVKGTPFDFRKSATIGSRIFDNDEQLRYIGGFDHFFLFNRVSKKTAVAKVKGEKTSIILEVYTDQPSLKFRTFHSLRCITSNLKKTFSKEYSSFALEAGPVPNTVDTVSSQSVLLHPGRINKRYFKYRFLHS